MRKILLFILLLIHSFADAQQIIPEGISYFGQAAYNRPVNYNISKGHAEAAGIFKNSASIGAGFNFYSQKVLISPLLKYTYTEGTASGWDGGLGGGGGFNADFYLGKLSAELEISGGLGHAKKLFIGGGFVFGNTVFKNIVGTESTFSGYSGSSSKQLSGSYFKSNYGGLLFDIKYFLSSSESKVSNSP